MNDSTLKHLFKVEKLIYYLLLYNLASRGGHKEAVLYLLEKKANIHDKNNGGSTALLNGNLFS
jgi:hypothetical protein